MKFAGLKSILWENLEDLDILVGGRILKRILEKQKQS
jgi:hypothetical protein